MAFKLYRPVLKGKQERTPALIVHKSGKAGMTMSAWAAMGLKKGDRFSVYIDEEGGQIGFDPKDSHGAHKVPSGTYLGVLNSAVRELGLGVGLHQLEKCDLSPVAFRVRRTAK
jgi:hypothetical protein